MNRSTMLIFVALEIISFVALCLAIFVLDRKVQELQFDLSTQRSVDRAQQQVVRTLSERVDLLSGVVLRR